MSPKSHGVRNMSVGMTLLPLGSSSNLHVHKLEEEIWYVVNGRGTAIVGGEEMPIEADVTIYIPPGQEHQLVNKADETLKVLWIFSPSGPEKEFLTKKEGKA